MIASDIPAFVSLLGEGRYGSLFATEDSADLAKKIIDLLRDDPTRKRLSVAAQERSKFFDWDTVAEQIFSVYEMAMVGSGTVGLASDSRSWGRLLGREGESS